MTQKLSILTALALLTLTGCPMGDPVVTNLMGIAGESEKTILYSRWLDALGNVPDPLALYELDLTIDQPRVLLDDVPLSTVTDGRYVAWVDSDAKLVKVKDLQAGTSKDYLAGIGSVSNPLDFTLLSLQDGRLLAHYPVNPEQLGYGSQYNFVVLDLGTGMERDITDSWVYATAALSGDYLALFTDSREDVDTLSLELGAGLDLVTLSTGERKTIDPSMRINGDGGHLFMANGLVVWQQFKDGGFKSRIRQYDVGKEKLSTLIEDFDSQGDSATLVDFDGDHLLLVRSPTKKLLGWLTVPDGPDTLELMTMEGESRVVASRTASLYRPNFTVARLVDHRVVWFDYTTTEFVVYDPSDNSTRRVKAIPD